MSGFCLWMFKNRIKKAASEYRQKRLFTFSIVRKVRDSNSHELALGSFQDCCNTIMRTFRVPQRSGQSYQTGYKYNRTFRDFQTLKIIVARFIYLASANDSALRLSIAF